MYNLPIINNSFFTSSNIYSILSNDRTDEGKIFAYTNQTLPITHTYDQNNHTTDSTHEIPSLFTINISSQYSRLEILETIINGLTAAIQQHKSKRRINRQFLLFNQMFGPKTV